MGLLLSSLAFGTLGFGVVFGYLSTRAVKNLKNDPSHKPSTLCATSDQWLLTRK